LASGQPIGLDCVTIGGGSAMDGLLERYLTRLPPPLAAAAGQRREEIAARLAEVWVAARREHPETKVSPEELVDALAARMREEDDPAGGLARLRAADLLLVLGCAAGHAPALHGFDAILSVEADGGAASVRAPGGMADEVKQRLREALLVGDAESGPGITAYAARGDLRSFLRISAVRECLRLMKRQRWEVGTDAGDLDELAPAVDPEIERLNATYREPFAACYREALGRHTPRERTLLRHHVVDRLTSDQMGSLYAVHRATAARWLERARARVAELTEELLAERLSLDAGEVASVIRLVRSQLDVSLGRLLAKD
jgi:RNA polymerase sigma-70 factor, ECF subfamily